MGKILVFIIAGFILGGAYWISARGWGIDSLYNKELIKSLNYNCKESEKDANGNCPPSAATQNRSYYPIFIGRGFRSSGRHSGSGSSRGGGK
jgi:hypothetical protein